MEDYQVMSDESQSRVEKYLSNLGSKVSHYQPLVERKFSDLGGRSISLGEISVKDMDYLTKEFIEYMYRKTLEDTAKEKGSAEELGSVNFLERGIVWFVQKVARRGAWSNIVNGNIERGDLFWLNNTLYASYKRAFNSKDSSEAQMHFDAVHELCHGIWVGLGGENPFEVNINEKERIRRLYVESAEAFASYGELVFCKELYPKDVCLQAEKFPKIPPEEGLDKRGLKIEQLVAVNGDRVLLDIPRNWRSLLK